VKQSARGYGVNYEQSTGFGMTSAKRLLLQALLSGLGDAVRSNDELAADRYHRRISQIAGHLQSAKLLNGCFRLAAAGWRRARPNVMNRSDMYWNSSSA
jgi:hypothetical protein